MIERWDAAVSPDDLVVHLGDFALASRERISDLVAALNGYKVLLLGNHDRSATAMRDCGFDDVVKGEYFVGGIRCVHDPADALPARSRWSGTSTTYGTSWCVRTALAWSTSGWMCAALRRSRGRDSPLQASWRNGYGVVSTPDRSTWRVEEPFRGRAGLDWCQELLEDYDLSMLSRLTVRDGSKRKTPACVWGTCYYPTKALPSYRITCSIKYPFPATTHTRRSPLYADENGTYPPVPDGLVKGQEFVATGPKPGRVLRWFRLYGKTRLDTLDEAIVWIVAHESYHFLRRTRQIPGRNAEIDADRFSDEALEHFREGWAYRFRALQEQRAEKTR